MTTITDVARSAGVTVGVVSRILNEDPTVRVREETRARVVAAARELNYVANHAARALRRARLGAIGLAVHDISNPVYAAIIEGAQRTASARGYVLMLADVVELAKDDAIFGRVVRSGSIDGLLLLPAGNAHDRRVARAATPFVPVVMVNERSRSLASVSLDDRLATALAARHLVQAGHRDIALLRLDGAGPRASDRVRGWRDVLASAGVVSADDRVIDGGHTIASGEQAARRLLDLAHRPTAVIASSVLSAVGAMGCVQAEGVRVPDELSFVGIQDVGFAPYLRPPLTVVRLPLHHLGAAAADLLIDRIDGAPVRHVTVSDPAPEIVARGSVATRSAA